jgi:hypothetical protein
MYLSHNIVNQLVRIESELTKLQLKNSSSAQFNKILDQKLFGSLFYLANNLGLTITLKDAEKLARDKKIETQDFRGELIENFKSGWKLATSIAESEHIGVNSHIILQINHTLAKGAVEDWKLKYRDAGDPFSLLYDDLLELVLPENKNTSAEQLVDNYVLEYSKEGENRFYKFSFFIYRLLQLQPFMAFNKFSIILIAELALSKLLGSQYNPVIMALFLTQQKPQILKAFEIPDAAAREVTWHELCLNFIAEAYEQANKQVNDKQSGKRLNSDKPFLDLNKRQLKILKYLQTIPTVKREDYVQMMDVSAMTAYRDLNVLLKHKLIKTLGTGRGTKYMLASR